ncbi:sugar ABC transporter ATP-binding protein [Leeia sp. TBRC 13508]|uniref:Sugar ABC transporter ATP-binding protein n=1 Tax=Leeia speluncae TaxID=2884804 RepID=A0ABS8D4Z8_9NEIS|nr:sugar ABC transporter ATP-binding protein [Leeia speluncae]MCB6183073.1 sugar ABC transporter ATP-binding protein [Leeia speluncae]
MDDILLEVTGLGKQYPGVKALDDVSLCLHKGEVLALFGENGAGKSTLISIIAGAQTPSEGKLTLLGNDCQFQTVLEARKHGISAVFQEFSLVPSLTVAENLFLGEEPTRFGLVNQSAIQQQAKQLLAQLGFDIPLSAKVGSLGRAHQQMVEIAKAFRHPVKLLILDEPTASLSDKETRQLFAFVERLKKEGVGILYITHRMQEIRAIADRVAVLRDGKHIGTVDAKVTAEERLIEMMAGRAIDNIYPKIAANPKEVLLAIQHVSTLSGVKDASITVRRGEVVGLAGLVGCGKSELLRAAFGIDKVTQGEVLFKGRSIKNHHPSSMWKSGFFYLPPDRRAEGLFLSFSSRSNITIPALRHDKHRSRLGGLSPRRELGTAKSLAKRVELHDRNLHKAVGLLSGGNQQKALFARGLSTDIDLYVFDEPTVGVDVGTRSALYELIRELCESGAAVVVISSDLPEVMHLSHRLYVMSHGRVVSELAGEQLTESNVLQHFFDKEEALS